MFILRSQNVRQWTWHKARQRWLLRPHSWSALTTAVCVDTLFGACTTISFRGTAKPTHSGRKLFRMQLLYHNCIHSARCRSTGLCGKQLQTTYMYTIHLTALSLYGQPCVYPCVCITCHIRMLLLNPLFVSRGLMATVLRLEE